VVAQIFREKKIFHFGWLDGNCHSEFLQYFNFESGILLPQVVAYFPTRQSYVMMNPRKFSEKNFERFAR